MRSLLQRKRLEKMQRQMEGVCTKRYGNGGKAVQNALHVMSGADFHDRRCQCFILFRRQVFFPQDNSRGAAGGNLFDPSQKVCLAQTSVGDAQNIRHTHSR